MRFLADENIPGDAVTELEAAGHDIVWVRTMAPGSKDEDILALAVREERIILTFDKDLGELAWRAGLPASTGIVLFRLPTPAPAKVGAIAATWAHRVMGTKNTLTAADAECVEQAFHARLVIVAGPPTEEAERACSRCQRRAAFAIGITLNQSPRNRGRRPSDAHHLRFAQSPALGRKVSDEFTVPLCRGHHRELHCCGDEAAWWEKTGIDAAATARALWLKTHPLPVAGVSAQVRSNSRRPSTALSQEADVGVSGIRTADVCRSIPAPWDACEQHSCRQ